MRIFLSPSYQNNENCRDELFMKDDIYKHYVGFKKGVI